MEAAAPYLLVCLLLLLVFAGVEIAVCLGIVSFLAMYSATQDLGISLSFLNSTAYEALRQYLFAVVPLFILMGQFIAQSGAAADLYGGSTAGYTAFRVALPTLPFSAMWCSPS